MQKDLILNGRARIKSYREFLKSLKKCSLPSLTHSDAIKLTNSDREYLCIRHDVDHDIEKAVIMANIENSLGIKASYYLLPPGDYGKNENYYGYIEGKKIIQSERLAEAAKEISSLGHEIGLHNDFLQLSIKTKRSIDDLILEQITFFRALGINIIGSASHGSRFARENNFTNYDIFSQAFNPTKSKRTIHISKEHEFSLFSVDMLELGLMYEAYSIKREIYISDTGSRVCINKDYYENLDLNILENSIKNAKKIVALIHPEWWTITNENPELEESKNQSSNTPTAPLMRKSGEITFKNRGEQPYRIAIKGDSCSRRAVLLNPEIFPKNLELIINEKSTSTAFAEAINGIKPKLDIGITLCDTTKMSPSLAHYYTKQFDRSILDAENLDLLIIDNYADMNYERWQHKAEGWSIWVHTSFIQNSDEFHRNFVARGKPSIAESIKACHTIIEHIRKKNPNLPVLFINQPIEFYPKLSNRAEFYKMGEEISKLLPHVYYSDPLKIEELTPTDINSCGEGLTLHFTKETYLKMISSAWDKGLFNHQCINEATIQQNKQDKDDAINLTKNTQFIEAHSSTSEKITPKNPRATLTYDFRQGSCNETCARQVEIMQNSLSEYFYHPEITNSSPNPRFTPMLISIDDISDYTLWEAHIKTFSSGERLRLKKKALQAGFFFKPFPWRQFIPDIHDINHSKPIRSGGEMRGTYLRSIEEMGGTPNSILKIAKPTCNIHWNLQFGVFLQESGRHQGSVEVNERLFAYISLKRCGDIAIYSQILGHASQLSSGIVVLLHHEMIRWIGENKDHLTNGLRYLMYGGMQNGGDGLLQFKRRSGFTPHEVTAYKTSINHH